MLPLVRTLSFIDLGLCGLRGIEHHVGKWDKVTVGTTDNPI